MPLTEYNPDEEEFKPLEDGDFERLDEMEEDDDLNAAEGGADEETEEGATGGIDGEYTAEDHAESQESDDEDNEYSRNVRRRIGKEVSRRKKIESERDIVRQELHNTQVELARIKSDSMKIERERLAEEITLLQSNAVQKLEEGATEDYVKISDRLVDAKVELSRNEAYVATEIKSPEIADGFTPAAREWMDSNKGWISVNKPKFERAKRLSNQLENEGYTVDDPAMYEEMDRRLNMSSPKPTETGHVPDGGQGQKPPQRRSGLTAEDKRLMAGYNLNPNNPAHRQEWLASKKV